MNKMLLVARHEYMTNLKSPTFLFAAFGLPILMIAIMAVVMAVTVESATSTSDLGRIGYVDFAEIIVLNEDSQNFVPIASVEMAQEMLNNEAIRVFLVIPEDYLATGDIEAFTDGNLSEAFTKSVDNWLLANLSENVASNFPLELLAQEINLKVQIQSLRRELTEDAAVGLFLTPMTFAIVFLIASQISSTFLMSSIIMEKTNRIIEILITSVTPMQLLMGKIIGLGSLGLTQLVIWIGVGVGIAIIGSDSSILSGIRIPPDVIVLSLLYFILTYFLLSSVIAGVGVIVNAEQESRQIAGLFVLPFVLPFMFIVQLLEEPNGALAIFLTLFPFSSAMTVIMRVSYSPVPIEQIILSLILLGLTSLIVTWISAKVFRWATLLYGKRPTPREIWRVIRSRQVEIGTLVREDA